MKQVIILFSFVSLVFSFLQEKTNDSFIYILSRNSNTKEGNLVLKYNNHNLNISHIGIALSNTEKSFVYNISYNSKNKYNSSLLKESFNSFWNSKNCIDNKIWKIKISTKEHVRIKKYIENLEKKKLFFDLDSTTNNGLYCSEFVYNALNSSGNSKFILIKKNKKMSGISKIIVGNDVLNYYPADFFLDYKFIQEITSANTGLAK